MGDKLYNGGKRSEEFILSGRICPPLVVSCTMGPMHCTVSDDLCKDNR